MQKALTLAKAHKIISGILLAALLFGGYSWYKNAHATAGSVQYVTQAATKGTVTVTVSATGQVSAESQIDLKPGSSGALTAVNVKAGDTVRAGQTIAVVDERSNNVSLAQAQASVLSAQANYDKVVAGLAGADLLNAQFTLDAAQTALDKAQKDYAAAVTDQQTNVTNAHTALLNSGLALVPSDSNSTATVTLTGSYNGSATGQYQVNLYLAGQGIGYQVSGISSQSALIQRGAPQPLGNGLYITFGTSGTLSLSTFWTLDVPNQTSSAYATNKSAYDAAIQSQTKALASAQDTINSAQTSLNQAQLLYQQKIAPASNSDVASAKASLLSAEAQLANASIAYSNNILKPPFDGTVAAVNNKTGDQVTNATVVATIITKEKLATVSLSEVDVAKIRVGQKATLTFDALPDLSLTGSVAQVDSLGTVTQGVVNYAVKIGFDAQDDRIKPGMSVAATIIIDAKTDVIAVPNSAVKNSNGTKRVQVLDAAGVPQSVDVTVGLTSDTLTEITSGLNVGDEVVTQTISSTTKAATPGTANTTRTGTGIPGLGGGGFGGGRGGN